MNGTESVAVRGVYYAEQLRVRGIRQIDNMNSAAVAAAEVTAAANHDGLEELLIVARVVPRRKYRGVRVGNVVNERAPAGVAPLHRNVPVREYVRVFTCEAAAGAGRSYFRTQLN